MWKYFIVACVAISLSHLSRRLIEPQVETRGEVEAPRFLTLSGRNADQYFFESIKKVLQTLGLEEVQMNPKVLMLNEWDLIWTYESFSFVELNFSTLNHYQRLNHIPGNTYLVSKSIMTTSTDSKYVPKAFLDAQALKEFAEKNPQTRFVQKLKANRGVSLKTASEMDFTTSGKLNADYFAQVFVEDPLLIAGHKFDFNIFVAITSVNPLRVYYYSKNVHFRFCKLPYDPNNFDEVDRYVISDTHIPGFDFPVIQKFFNQSYTHKIAFDTHMLETGRDPTVIYKQLEDCIQSLVMSKEPMLMKAIQKLGAKYGKIHFFELFRFDFLIDAKLKLHLMEINMSPNLYASRKLRHNRHVFESVLYNFFNLVGVGSYLKKRHIRLLKTNESSYLCHDNSLTVLPEVCMRDPCINSCDASECDLCWNCLSKEFKYDLKMAYLEHMNMGDMKRVVPPSNDVLQRGDEHYWKSLSKVNKLFAKWCMEMCKKSRHFC